MDEPCLRGAGTAITTVSSWSAVLLLSDASALRASHSSAVEYLQSASTATSQRNQESCYLGDSGSVGRLDEAWAFSMRISVQRKRRQISPVAVSDDSQSPGHAHTHTQRVTSIITVLETASAVPLLTVLSSEVIHAEKSRRDRERPATPEHRVRHNRHEVCRPIDHQQRQDQQACEYYSEQALVHIPSVHF